MIKLSYIFSVYIMDLCRNKSNKVILGKLQYKCANNRERELRKFEITLKSSKSRSSADIN